MKEICTSKVKNELWHCQLGEWHIKDEMLLMMK